MVWCGGGAGGVVWKRDWKESWAGGVKKAAATNFFLERSNCLKLGLTSLWYFIPVVLPDVIAIVTLLILEF